MGGKSHTCHREEEPNGDIDKTELVKLMIFSNVSGVRQSAAHSLISSVDQFALSAPAWLPLAHFAH